MGREQLLFAACRFCSAWIANPLDHHCAGIDADRAKFWAHLWRYLGGLALYFELSAELEASLRGKTLYGEEVTGAGVSATCRKCGQRFEFLVRADNKGTAYALWQHQTECFPVRLVPKPMRCRRTRVLKATA